MSKKLEKNVSTRTANRVDKIADARQELKVQIAELEAKVKELDDKLKTEVAKNGANILTDRWSVCSSTTMRGGFDSTKFKAEHPKLYEEYQKEKEEVPVYRVTPR